MKLTKEERRALRAKGWCVNKAETELSRVLKSNSIGYVRRGYPDFTILKDDEIVGFVEVKPRAEKKLKIDQERFRRFCERFGIPFIKWVPEDGEAPIIKFKNHEILK